ncbi:MAG: hypothetical protein HIU85_16960 [Proteobacteria bacterium]|nr:hypothetical protein [Pseudomonadota bacterium]
MRAAWSLKLSSAFASFFGVLSTGERIAVAFVLDRYDLIQRARGAMAEAVHRLRPQWTAAALHVQRNGWQDDPAP